VRSPVQFDREPGRIAIKIENEVACDLLPAEVQFIVLAATEGVPEQTLGRVIVRRSNLANWIFSGPTG
jgi:hypothetical protein